MKHTKKFIKKTKANNVKYDLNEVVMCTHSYKIVNDGETVTIINREKSRMSDCVTFLVWVRTCTNQEIQIPTKYIRRLKKNEKEALSK